MITLHMLRRLFILIGIRIGNLIRQNIRVRLFDRRSRNVRRQVWRRRLRWLWSRFARYDGHVALLFHSPTELCPTLFREVEA